MYYTILKLRETFLGYCYLGEVPLHTPLKKINEFQFFKCQNMGQKLM